MRVIKNARLVSQGGIEPRDIGIEGGTICAIAPAGSLRGEEFLDAQGNYLSHGFIDIHVHGGGDSDFMDGTTEAFHRASAFHLRHGTTAMVPTTLAADRSELELALAAYNACRPGFPDGARLLGIHVEGPYLAPAQAGAQNPAFIRDPSPEEYEALCRLCPDIIRWTVAPERPGALEMGDWMRERGILPSIGHSDADYDRVAEAVRHGYRHVTHLYSAMSTIVRRGGFRCAGIVESAYLLPELTSEVIADGCHLPGCLLEMAYRFIGPRRLCLVTDAMRAAGRTQGESELGGRGNRQRVILEDGVAKMPDRKAFAGSICTADRLVRNAATLTSAGIAEAVRMITETPADILGLGDRTGYVKPGRAADLVLFNEHIDIQAVLTDGEVRYRAPSHECDD